MIVYSSRTRRQNTIIREHRLERACPECYVSQLKERTQGKPKVMGERVRKWSRPVSRADARTKRALVKISVLSPLFSALRPLPSETADRTSLGPPSARHDKPYRDLAHRFRPGQRVLIIRQWIGETEVTMMIYRTRVPIGVRSLDETAESWSMI